MRLVHNEVGQRTEAAAKVLRKHLQVGLANRKYILPRAGHYSILRALIVAIRHCETSCHMCN